VPHGRLGAFCGIGNPRAFSMTLQQAGCELAMCMPLADHHSYTAEDMRDILSRARDLRCSALITTEKDAVKVEPLLERTGPPDVPVYALQIDLDFVEGSASLTAAILEAVGHNPVT
jgi:tetraacyldisaccharide 4'-kinase